MSEFIPFNKIPRLSRDCVITEKIDGTNAQIFIHEDGVTMEVGSRNRWITVDNDNYGFAAWCHENKEELLQLGSGRHFGEWWGAGIQRRYGLEGSDKRFSLFNTGRWEGNPNLPSICGVVPVMYKGTFTDEAVESCISCLRDFGSIAVPGFMDPEGVVVWHSASGSLYKKTVKTDHLPKGGK